MSGSPSYLTGDWDVLSYDPVTGHKVEIMDLGDQLAVRRTYTATAELVEQNRVKYNESDGKTWGDGQIAASIPLNIFYEKFAEAARNGDSRYINKILNDSDYRDLRTFKGKL